METKNMKITPKWSKSKDEIWNEMFANIEDVKVSPKIRSLNIWRYAAAAAVALVILSSSFAFLYTTTETASRGLHLAITLPDGSNVNMNAETEIKYKPYWWFVSRSVELTGEAYFEVKRGSKFSVKSNQNRVNVLGTSFNIFNRANKYIVTCITGRVEVVSNSEKAILTPNMQAYLFDGKFNVTRSTDAKKRVDWVGGKFSFIGVPLLDVIEEIERQYDVKIRTTSKLDHLYTGNFSRKHKPEEVLEIIGKPFGITFSIEQ